MSNALFSLRAAEERDLVYLNLICAEHGLGLVESVAETNVAVNDEDIPVGFIHIEIVNDDPHSWANGAYVYPVAVFEAWQHHGVAAALVEHELALRGELRLVACKESQGFYPKAGFEPLDWNFIAERIAKDCEFCGDHATCGPIPFIRTSADRPLNR
jgi:N-acetylglutamate synthase-like GNAT family acetyltransferase